MHHSIYAYHICSYIQYIHTYRDGIQLTCMNFNHHQTLELVESYVWKMREKRIVRYLSVCVTFQTEARFHRIVEKEKERERKTIKTNQQSHSCTGKSKSEHQKLTPKKQRIATTMWNFKPSSMFHFSLAFHSIRFNSIRLNCNECIVCSNCVCPYKQFKLHACNWKHSKNVHTFGKI